MRLTLLHNPGSGDEDHDPEALESTLTDEGHEVAYRSLEDDNWREGLDDAVDLVVVAGGDGSIRKLFTAIDRRPILALTLPVGSANNIARTLGLDFDAALAMLDDGPATSRRPFDVWDVQSNLGQSRCVEAVGGGLFAEVLAEAEDSRADPSGDDKVDFGLQLLAETLAAAVPRRWILEIDGSRTEEELIGVEAMNIREIGANLRFATDADPGDGLLDVALVRPEDADALAAYAAMRLEDEDARPPRFEIRRGRHIVMEPPGEVRLHVDDLLPAWDLSTTNWVEVTCADVRLDVLVPARVAR